MSNSIMKDGEESIPLQTAIARWADRAFKAQAEIDRLRAERDGQREENAKLRKSIEENLESLQRENSDLLDFIGSVADMDNEAALRARIVAKSVLRRYAKTAKD